MQRHALIGSPDAVNPRSTDWPGYNPTRGNLEPEVLAPLCVSLSPSGMAETETVVGVTFAAGPTVGPGSQSVQPH